MADENSFFIQVLSDHLNERKTIPPETIDWSIVLKLGIIHQVEGIVYYQCKNFISAKELDRLEQRYFATLYYYKNRERLLTNIDKEFSNNGIQYIEIKGLKAARYYPIPGLRTMGDNDLVVHESDRERASKILSDMGFINQYEYTGKERGYSLRNIHIELHHHLIYDEVVTIEEQNHFFNNCWKYVDHGDLNHSFHFLFLLAHVRKHMLNEGVGIRQFMDIAVMAKNDPSLNWSWIEDKLKDLKIDHFAQTCFAMIEYWFAIKIPLSFPIIEEGFAEQATKRILNNGVYGFEDINNRRNGVINQLQQYDGPRWMFRTKLVFEKLFPSYETLRIGRLYRFLDGRPWLLPVAWVCRIYNMAVGKATDGIVILDRIMTSDELIASREKELRQWGLIE